MSNEAREAMQKWHNRGPYIVAGLGATRPEPAYQTTQTRTSRYVSPDHPDYGPSRKPCPACDESDDAVCALHDERRERYAAAIGEFFDQEYSDLLSLSAADAAMAVADEEFAPIREEITNLHRDAVRDADENARLRRELRRTSSKLEDARNGLDSLRAELERKTSAYDELSDVALNRVNQLRATIARVEAVLDSRDSVAVGVRDWGLVRPADIRDALKGGTP